MFLSISLGATSQEADPSLFCPNSTDNIYDRNTSSGATYHSNLNLLLSSFSNLSRTNSFYNSTVPLNTSSSISNPAYGLFMCRGDVDLDTCERCITAAAGRLLANCSNTKRANIWYQFCILRYSDQSIFSILDRGLAIYVFSLANVTDGDRFTQVLGSTMNATATMAANSGSGKKFAVQEANFNAFQTLYTLAQCTPDLSVDDCDTCLRDGISRIPSCCDRKSGGRIFFPSCEVRFDTSKFYTITAQAPPPRSLPNITTPSPSPSTSKGGRISTGIIVGIVASVLVSVALFVLAFIFLRRRPKKRYDAVADASADGSHDDMSTTGSSQYNLSQVQAATNSFSNDAKIGEGGFGAVYKGRLPNGQEIAVKRLSKTSIQGAQEFKNEILLVAKLQHRNLVRLLGFSFQEEEMILIYEFVANKSLDCFLFDPEKQSMLNWSRRQKIIQGIARGLVYLHEDSRLKIIHRDLKASNILLDANMNAKIADFGMARIFTVDQSEEKTSRIAGTYGYMAPEYAMHGQFSVKSDVYSFGVLLLEIISGKKNSNFYQSDRGEDFLSYAWKNWRNGTPVALLDPILSGDSSYNRNEVIKCIHIGLLCVQEEAEQRPTMASVVLMLNSYSVTLPAPHQPAFFAASKTESLPGMDMDEFDKSTSKLMTVSVDDSSITEVHPR